MLSTYMTSLLKREDCSNTDPSLNACEKYVSEFTKTGIPLIIGLSLFFCATVIIFFIVRRQRRRQRAEESAKEGMIDDNMELTWVPIPKSNDNNWRSAPGPHDHPDLAKPPPSYNQGYPPPAQQKDRGRRASTDSDYA